MNCLYFSLCVTTNFSEYYLIMLKNALTGLGNYYNKKNGYDVIVTSNIDIEFPEFNFVKVLRTDYSDLYDICDQYQKYDKETFTKEEYLHRNIHSSWMHKWYALEQIAKLGYDKILFSDCDVLINGDLNNIFSLIDKEDNENTFYASLSYDEHFEKHFNPKNTINSGHFVFRPNKVNVNTLYESIVKKRKYMDAIMAEAYEREEATVTALEHIGFFNEQYCAQLYFEECGYDIEPIPNKMISGYFSGYKPEEVEIFHYYTANKDEYLNYHTKNNTKDNTVNANIDPEILEQIKNSLSTPTAYLQNTNQVDAIKWTWDNGKTTTELTYADGDIQKRRNDTVPPTAACHDIAHFIACFNGNMEWDYKQSVNHLCEYNAVAIENILVRICHNIMHNIDSDYKLESQQVFDHLKWFSEEYYKIPKQHPCRKGHIQLLSDFLNVWEVNKTIKVFNLFYYAWAIQNHVGNPNFQLQLTMTKAIDFYDERSYNHICKLKEMLLLYII